MSPALGTLNYAMESGNKVERDYSQKTARLIDQEVERIINERYQECKQVLTENKDKVEKLAEALLEKEVLDLP
jgi:ATP-dependent Zn protease